MLNDVNIEASTGCGTFLPSHLVIRDRFASAGFRRCANRGRGGRPICRKLTSIQHRHFFSSLRAIFYE
jgi:hypothetical protein